MTGLTFTGTDGARHRIRSFRARDNAGVLLCDEWEGKGLRLLCALSTRDGDNGAQAEAVIREYRVDAATTNRPLSRRVSRQELL